MRYLSTRGLPDAPRPGFSDILLEGLAPDGGLYLPESYPQVDAGTLAAWRRVLADDGYAEKMLARGGTLDQLVRLGATLEDIRPRLTELADLIPSLHESVDALGKSVSPLGDLANRFPGGRKKVTS